MTIEDALKQYGNRDPKRLIVAPVQDILAGYTLRQLGEGLQSRIFRVEGTPWVIKEGRYDMQFPVTPSFKLPLAARSIAALLRPLGFIFQPEPDQIMRQIGEYQQLQRYLGFFGPDDDRRTTEPQIAADQQRIRTELCASLPELERHYGSRFQAALAEILSSPLAESNFLPREELLVGPAISPENEGRQTSFVFQHFVAGSPIHDVDVRMLDAPHRRQLVLLLYLILLLRVREHVVPDTRPRYPLLQAYNWITKTDNILVTDDGFMFIDTHWLWSLRGPLIHRGLPIPRLTLWHTQSALKDLLTDTADF